MRLRRHRPDSKCSHWGKARRSPWLVVRGSSFFSFFIFHFSFSICDFPLEEALIKENKKWKNEMKNEKGKWKMENGKNYYLLTTAY
jgi:hypothetical protein